MRFNVSLFGFSIFPFSRIDMYAFDLPIASLSALVYISFLIRLALIYEAIQNASLDISGEQHLNKKC